MGVLQRSVNHSVIGRAIADKTIHARDPQLLKLPLPLPSVPVLSPLLSPLVGGSNDNSKPATTTKASPPPQQTPPSSSGGNSGGSSGGSSGGNGGNSGGNGGNSGSSSSSSGSSPPSSGNSGSSSSSGSGSSDSPPPSSGSSSSSSSSGTTPGDTPSSSNGDGGSDTSPSASTPSGSSGATPSSSSSGNNVDNQSSGVGGSPVLSSASGSGNGSDPSSLGGAPPAGAANAGSIPETENGSSGSSGSSGTSGSHSTGTTVAIGASSPSTSQGTTGGNGPASVGGSGTGAAQTGGHHGLSGGAIAVIVMALLFLLVAVVIFFVRRRTRARRDERANAWWFSRKRNSETYGDRDSKEIVPASGTRSARSSFATTVDHSTHPRRSSEYVIPPLPPMAEVGRANGTAPTLVLDTSHFAANAQVSDPRFSIGSGHSNNSDNSATQYLVVQRESLHNPELGTPMSVRPFSPSESFAFPRPPDPVGDRTSAYSRMSSGTLGAASKSQSSPTDASFRFSGDVPPTPALPSVTVSPTPINATPAITSDPFADDNPFDDPLATASSASSGEFADVEYIRRPFFPTLPDELAVKPDDSVRVLQAFDDGWALVEKVDLKGKGKEAAAGEQGLIPIDCLREPGQDLTTFIAAKRLSSYTGSVDVGLNSITAL